MTDRYCKPWNAGLGSSEKAVCKRLGRLLDALGDEINEHIVSGQITTDVFNLRWQIIDNLEKDGWSITIPGNKYIVRRKSGMRETA